MYESKYLQFTINGDSVSVSGKTFHVRNELRTLGGTWDARRSVWTIPLSVYSGTMKNDLISIVTRVMDTEARERKRKRQEEKDYEIFRESVLAKPVNDRTEFEKNWLKIDDEQLKRDAEKIAKVKKDRVLEALAESATTGKYHWICCENCDVVDWSRGITCCRAHGSDGYSVRVYGRLYTGD